MKRDDPKTASGALKTPSGSRPRKERLPWIALFLVFLALAAAIIAFGYSSYRRYARNFELEVSRKLTSIADLKVSQIVQWRKERLLDAAHLNQNSTLYGLVFRCLQDPADPEARDILQTLLGKYWSGGEYDHIYVLDRNGKTGLSIPAGIPPVAAAVVRRLPDIWRSGRPEILDFYMDEADSRVSLSLLVPITAESAHRPAAGILALHIDPKTYLYPFLSRWPSESRTAETLIVRRDGDDVLFLNELRFQKNTALNLRIPIREQTIAGRAVEGREGIVKGLDYRRKPVIGSLRRIPDSPWFLIARIDTNEVYAPIGERLWMNSGMMAAFLFAAALGLISLQRRQKIRFLRERLDAERHLRAVSSRQEALIASLPEIIMEVDQRKVYVWANQPGFDFFGEDVIGKEADFYFEGEQDTYQKVAPVFNGAEDVIYVESWQRRRDGRKRLLAWWCRTIKDPEGNVTGALSSARDITEERQAEEARRESEARYRTLVDNAPIAILVNRENRVVLANDACLRLFGATSPEQLLGKSPLDLVHPDFHPMIRERIERLQDHGKAVPMLEEKIIRLDGVAVDVEITAAPFQDEGVTSIHVVLNDITERKKAEARAKAALEALKTSEEKFRKAFITSPDAININRLSDGMYVSINKGFTQAMGYREEEIVGRTSLECDIWADAEDRRRLVEGLRNNGEVENLEARFRRKNGELGVGLMSAVVIEIDRVPHILSITRDITERKRAETALRENESKFRSIFENIQDAYYETALDGTILEISPSIRPLSDGQFSREDLLGKSILDFYAYPEERSTFLTELFKRGQLTDYEIALLNRDGIPIPCSLSSKIFRDAGGRPEKIVGSIRNISERKKAEARTDAALAALRENEAIFDQFMTNSPVYMFFKDENIRAIRLSANFKDMLGLPVEEALGKNMDELFPSDLAKSMIADDRRILREGKQVNIEEELNGRFYATIKFPIHVEGKPRYLAGFTIDITERKLAEDRMKAALSALRTSLREKELLLQEIHHRVKNNMQIISSLFNLEAEHASPETREILKTGQTRIRSLSLVHERLYRAADLSRIDLSEYIQDLAVHLFQVYLVDSTQVRLETDFERVSLDISSAIPFGLILNELIANALKHAFPDGRKGVIRIRLARAPGDSVELQVFDDGVGLPEGIDFRNPSSFGFEIVSLLVGQLEAEISLERKGGTTFTLKFKELKYKPRI